MKQYSFASVDLIVDGITIDGFADSNAIITAARSAPQHGKVMDARGKMVAISSSDKSGIISFDLLQSSDSTAYLHARALSTHNTGTSGGADLFAPVQALIKDKMGNTVATGVNGIITMTPPLVRGTGLSTDTWLLEFEQLWIVRGTSESIGI